jgi:hypothetical protein
MSYEVRLTEQAEADLAALPAHLQEFLEQRLQDLSVSPARTSRRSVSPPFPPNFMLHEVEYCVGKERWRFYVLFRYHQDETAIVVNSIGYQRV